MSQITSNRCKSRDALVVEDNLIAMFRRAIDSSQDLDQRAHLLSYRKRQRTIRKFEEVIQGYLSSDLRIPDLCAHMGINQRTLESFCNDYVGMPPRRYLTVRRLNAVRNHLLHAEADGVSIAAIAGRFGFKHPGRFSQIYRSLFNELPSNTLRKR